MLPDFPFDAVLFDLDGTLVATDRFWPQAARVGARQAYEELGLEERPLPTTYEWMGMVGLPLEEGFAAVFADLDEDQRSHLMKRCVEAEHEFLGQGRAAFLPGVPETLARLRELGVRLGIASNCGRDYLQVMMQGLGLERWIEEGRCLDSLGIGNKADMIEDLLQTFGTRRAVMVGDRIGDRDSAWANGLPHVHLARGYARNGEEVPCEAIIDGFDELLPTLRRRTHRLNELIDRLGLDNPAGPGLGIDGLPGSGRSLLAPELRFLLEQRGVREPRVTLGKPDHPQARRLWVEATEDVLERRIAGRDARLEGPAPLRRWREEDLPAARELGASTAFDAVLETSNLLLPVARAPRP